MLTVMFPPASAQPRAAPVLLLPGGASRPDWVTPKADEVIHSLVGAQPGRPAVAAWKAASTLA